MGVGKDVGGGGSTAQQFDEVSESTPSLADV